MKKTEQDTTEINSGEYVVCIINSRANLTVGKEYKVIQYYKTSPTDNHDMWSQFKNDGTIVVVNDEGNSTWYDHMRFVPKNKFRSHLINDILK